MAQDFSPAFAGLKTRATKLFESLIAGLAIGIAAVLALGPALAAVLFGVSPIDPLTILTTAIVLGGVAMAAAWWPAAAASRVDPVAALRYE